LASKDKVFYSKKTLNINGKLYDLAIPKVMGILNITGDSFYDGGQYLSEKKILQQVEKMIREGADFIDIGGYSSRPGAQHIEKKVEFERIQRGVHCVKSVSDDIPISIDTFRTEIARQSLDLGVHMINDISAGELDAKMFDVVREYNVPYIMMHMVGNPANMMKNTNYQDLMNDILNYFIKKLEQLTHFGIKDVIIDVGFGFAKSLMQNHELLHKLKLYKILNVPILAGISRKSMIYKALDTSPEKALNGTSILNTIAIMQESDIIRVHDVQEAKEVINLVKLQHP